MTSENKYFYVYILSNKRKGTLYIGVTNNLLRRVIEHRLKIVKGFTEKYEVINLVYFEIYKYADKAIEREKKLKKWNRDWKIILIEKENKEWKDLLYTIASKEEIKLMEEIVLDLVKQYDEKKKMDSR